MHQRLTHLVLVQYYLEVWKEWQRCWETHCRNHYDIDGHQSQHRSNLGTVCRKIEGYRWTKERKAFIAAQQVICRRDPP